MTHIETSSIPPELKALPRWVVWRWAERDGKRTKPPFDAKSGEPGDATDPHVWLTFTDALGRLPAYEGIGFAVGEDTPYTGVDLDGCIDESGRIEEWAEEIVARLDSYTEITPSGKGLRIWVRGKLPRGRRRKGRIEMYDGGRYFTVTGRRLCGSRPTIEERSAELAALHAEIFPPKETGATQPRPASSTPSLSDRELLDRMFAAKNGAEIEALFNGTSSRHASGSEADLALCAHLAFWTGGDIDAIDRLFRLSALCDDKWLNRADYRDRTIAKALEGASFYDPNRKANGAGNGHANGHANGDGDGNGRPPRVAAAIPDQPRNPDESIDDPHRLARSFLTRSCSHPDGLTLRFWNDEWFGWDGRAWRVRPDREINAQLTGAIKDEFDRYSTATGEKAKPVTTKAVANVAQALRHLALLPLDACPRQPAWLDRDAGEDLPDAREVLVASNAIIHLPSYAAGDQALMPLTPRLFSPNALDYAFIPQVPEPAEFLGFLRDLWADDEESIACLQEWFGYLLTPDTSLQKILMLIGPKRSGKGTIGRILRALVGPGNVAAPTLSGIATPFGLQPLIAKTVALIADARLSGRADSQIIVERLLSISGEDAQTIDRKHLTSWTGELPTRFVLISNELPRLGDSSGALPSRMVLLRLTRSFYGEEDRTLTARLLAERPAILRWAIAGWERLRERGRFLQPGSGRQLLDDLDELSSPIASFVEERCRVGPDCRVPIKELFEAWKSWCKEKGKDHPGDEQGFGRSLHAYLPNLKITRPRIGDERRIRAYEGIEPRIAF